MKKYVIIEHISPIVFSSPQNHNDFLVINGKRATSGAYVMLDEDGKVNVGGASMTSSLEEGPHDKELLEKFFKDCKMISFKGG